MTSTEPTIDAAEARRLDLVNAELDGRLSADERAEFAALLESDPGVRTLRDDLRSLAEHLADLPELEPPGALRRALRAALPAHSTPAAAPRVSASAGLRAWLGVPGVLRLGAAFAAGLAVGALVLAPDPGLDLRQLTGTMAAYDAGADDAIERLNMEAPGVAGSVGLHRRGSMYVLEYDLEADRPVEVLTAVKGAEAAFNGFAHIGDSNTRAVAEGRRVWLTVDGHGRYAIFLSRPRSEAGEIEIDIYAGEELLHRGSLPVPVAARAP